MGQVNDYAYKDDPERADDSRYVHRGRFDWALVDQVEERGSVAARIFGALSRLEAVRRGDELFDADAQAHVVDYSDQAVLWIVRRAGGRELNAVFNFSDGEKHLWMPGEDEYVDLVGGESSRFQEFDLAAWDFRWWVRRVPGA